MLLPAAMARRHPEATAEAELGRTLCLVWFVAVIIPISLISTKLPGYVTPLFPAMALLVGPELARRWSRPERAPWVALLVLGAVLGVAVCFLPGLGDKAAARAGVAQGEGKQLLAPALVWAAGYGIICLGAVLALVNRARLGTHALVVGQAVAIAAILGGILPLLAPYMEGSREYRLAEIATRELPHLRVVLYETRPEAVVFVLRHPVPVYDRRQQEELLNDLAQEPGRTDGSRAQAGPGVLAAPAGAEEVASR